jgi:CTP synthase
LYEIPIMLEEENLPNIVCEKLEIPQSQPNLEEWRNIIKKEKNIQSTVTIGIVGKYVELQDAYMSVVESLKHAGIYNDTQVKIKWINAIDLEEENYESQLKGLNGILVPGGFGERGTEGKINAVTYARVNKIPFFGICLGMQCAVIEYARNVAGYKDAHSAEISKTTTNPVIDIMEDQKNIQNIGGTMRLGSYPCKLEKNTHAHKAYKQDIIQERHRHRYEFI